MVRQEETMCLYTAHKSLIVGDYANKTTLMMLCNYTAHKSH